MTKILTYREWKTKNTTIKNICQECLGSGTVHCSHCGSDYNCPECDGEGHTGISRKDYETAIKKDHELLERWLNK